MAVAVFVVGVGSTSPSAPAEPTAVSTSPAFSSISAGSWVQTCGLTQQGGAACWGANYYGGLGDGTTTPRVVPVTVDGLGSGVAAVSTGDAHACAITTSGGAKCWGRNIAGDLGDGTGEEAHTPVDVVGLQSGVAAISAGVAHTCAVTSAGAAKCWGAGVYLGNGTTDDSSVPVQVSGLTSGVVAISAAWNHTCALTNAGTVECWGMNDFGQLGDGTNHDRLKPVIVSGLDDAVAITTGGVNGAYPYGHSCALTAAGAVKCWGWNGLGQLGNGTTADSAVPVDVQGLQSGVVAINAGMYATCAVASGGAAKCWGYNSSGQLGDGTRTSSALPVSVHGLQSGVIDISAGAYHTCALMASGTGKCWGYNGEGQLGDGTATDRLTPANVTDQPVLAGVGVTVPTQAVAGKPFTVTAVAHDALGVKIDTYDGGGTWSDLSGALSPSAPADFVDGVSTSTATVADPYHRDKITVATGGFSGQSTTFDVGFDGTIRVAVPALVTAGKPFTVTATARDPNGNVLTSYNGPGTWSNLRGGLSPTAPSDFVNGVSTTSATVVYWNVKDSINLVSGGIGGWSAVFYVARPLAAVQVRVAAPVAAGQATTVTATALDASGRKIDTYSGTATWSDLSGALSAVTPSNFVNGVSKTTATFPQPFHADRVSVSTGGKTGQSATFNVYGPLAKITVRVATPVTHGVPFTVRATATDSAGNLLTGYNAPATWSDLSGSLSPSSPAPFASGVSTTQPTVANQYANDRITLTSGAVSRQSGYFNVG